MRYITDHSDRLVQVLQSNNNLTTFTYDDSNQTSIVSEVLNNTTFKSTYTYDSDKKLTELQDSLNYKVGYGYDAFGRLSTKTFKTALGTTLFTTSYTYTGYTDDNVNYTSAQLASITNGSSTISYTYDANGNITVITQGSTVIAYVYDDLGQVVRENNARDSKTIIYDYDLAGNILSRTTYAYTTGSVDGLTPTDTFSYTYGNSVWEDQLTAFNGLSISYDDLGNPLAFGNRSFSWEKGRQLSGLTDTNLEVSYTYNDAGIRTSKTVNNVTTTYQLSGDKVTAEITGNQIIYYTYDASGHVVTMNVNGAEYYYVRNGQNDVIALVDNTGAIVVEYTYSTYGEVLTTTGSLSTTIGELNPYRYRGYRYDTESGLYYLQSRYFNPVWGRFTNADVLLKSNGSIIGENMYSYCSNNPVSWIDPSGLMRKFPGEIHNQVIKDILKSHPYLTPEFRLIFELVDDMIVVSYGRADLVNEVTGEVWEVKPKNSVGIRLGNNQIERYKRGLSHIYDEPKSGGDLGAGEFDYENIFGKFHVTYNDGKNGLILYEYTFEKRDLTKAISSVALTIIVLGGVAAIASGFTVSISSGSGSSNYKPAFLNR